MNTSTRRAFLATLAAAPLAHASLSAAPVKRQPNIVFILADDLWKPATAQAQLYELFLIKRLRSPDHDSDPPPIFDRHDFGIMIGISS